jgi:hypothetical protein
MFTQELGRKTKLRRIKRIKEGGLASFPAHYHIILSTYAISAQTSKRLLKAESFYIDNAEPLSTSTTTCTIDSSLQPLWTREKDTSRPKLSR